MGCVMFEVSRVRSTKILHTLRVDHRILGETALEIPQHFVGELRVANSPLFHHNIPRLIAGRVVHDELQPRKVARTIL